jgi:CRP/FNR family transcriptional regulator, cyclic AMP receptor protein
MPTIVSERPAPLSSTLPSRVPLPRPHSSPPLPLSGTPGSSGHPRLWDAEYAAVRTGAWFSRLPEPLQAAILAAAQVRRVAASGVIAQRGASPTGWVGVASGALRLGTALSDGRSLTLDFVGPGQWFGDVALVDGRPLDLDVTAHVASVLVVVPKAGLSELIERFDGLGDALLQLNCQRLRHMFRRFEELHTLSLPQRLARQVLRLMHQFGRPVAEGVRIELGLSQGDLASMACGSRQRVNRSLRQMQAQGVLQLGPSRMVVLDEAGLEAVADGRMALVGRRVDGAQ